MSDLPRDIDAIPPLPHRPRAMTSLSKALRALGVACGVAFLIAWLSMMGREMASIYRESPLKRQIAEGFRNELDSIKSGSLIGLRLEDLGPCYHSHPVKKSGDSDYTLEPCLAMGRYSVYLRLNQAGEIADAHIVYADGEEIPYD